MKISSRIAALLLAAAAWPLANSAPLNGSQVTQYRTTYDYVFGQSFINNVYTAFAATAWDELDTGLRQGRVELIINDYWPGIYIQVVCQGPEYAGVVVINEGNGSMTLNATLDPLTLGCQPFTWGLTVPLTLNLAGQPNGTYDESTSGVSTYHEAGLTYKRNYQGQWWRETVNGTIGSISGPFNTWVQTERVTRRTRVK